MILLLGNITSSWYQEVYVLFLFPFICCPAFISTGLVCIIIMNLGMASSRFLGFYVCIFLGGVGLVLVNLMEKQYIKFFIIWHIEGKFLKTCLVAQLCLTLCDAMDCSLPGSSVHGILQARILEWVVISCSRGSSWPRDGTHISCPGRWVLY